MLIGNRCVLVLILKLRTYWIVNMGVMKGLEIPWTVKMFLSKDLLCHRGHDCMVVGFTTTRAISAYHHYSCEFESHSW